MNPDPELISLVVQIARHLDQINVSLHEIAAALDAGNVVLKRDGQWSQWSLGELECLAAQLDQELDGAEFKGERVSMILDQIEEINAEIGKRKMGS